MAFLTLLSIAEKMPEPSGFMQIWQVLIVKVFDFVSDYGWRIIVFTIVLKLIVAPLEIYQRYVMRKNERIKKRIQPDLDKLEVQFGHNRQLYQQKMMQLNKKEGISYGSTCITMLVPIIIMLTIWPSVMNLGRSMYMKQYLTLYDIYETKYEQVIEESGLVLSEEGSYYMPNPQEHGQTSESVTAYINTVLNNAVSEAQDEVKYQYDNNIRVSFLWIKDIWSPDVPWKKPVLDYQQFYKALGKHATDLKRTGLTSSEQSQLVSSDTYNRVTEKIRTSPDNKANGYLVLPILSVGVIFLSQYVSSKQQKKSGMMPANGQGASTMKMMMWTMPIVAGIFALSYTSLLALYVVTNSLASLLINLASTKVLNLIDKYNEKRTKFVKAASKDEPQIMRYGRPDPNAIVSPNNKDVKKKKK